MDYLNMAFLIAVAAIVVICLLTPRASLAGEGLPPLLEDSRFEVAFVVCALALAAFVRLFQLDAIPSGMHQDEASIGYDAWALWTYGIDRNGYVLPVYPMTWGAGQGPLGMYLAAPFLGLLGPTLFAYRLPFALLGVATVATFYFLVRRVWGRPAAYVGIVLLALTPWHVVLSRWGLDANPLPFFVTAGALFFVRGADGGRTADYLLSAVLYSLAMYVYGAAMVAVPITLVTSAVYAIRSRRMTVRQLVLAVAAFLVVMVPLMAFYAINLLGLPEVRTPFFSIPRLTVMRSGAVFLALDSSFLGNFLHSAKTLLLYLTLGAEDNPTNQVEGFGILYLFAFPLTFVGMARTMRRGLLSGRFCGETVLCSWFVGGVVLALLIHPAINRLSVLFVPVVAFLVSGLCWVAERRRTAFVAACCLLSIGAALFCATYFGSFRGESAEIFQSGLGEALSYASERGEGKVYCSDADTNGAYVIALFSCRIPPQEFVDTVVYDDPAAQFRMARSFGRYVFSLPADIGADPGAEYVVSESELDRFGDGWRIDRFGRFAVASRAGA